MHATSPLFAPSLDLSVTSHTKTFVFRGNELLIGETDMHLPDQAIVAHLPILDTLVQPLGVFAETPCHCVSVGMDTEAPAGFQFVRLRALLTAEPDTILSLAGRAYQIAEWARTHQFCGVCGTKTQRMAAERCFKCPACSAMAYPRISPAMMVLVTRGNEALLARHAASTNNTFSALAGFVEAGESVEETVHREVMEEVGLRVHKLRYFGSQPWPFPHSLMIAFTAEYLSGEIRLDEHEIAEAGWFPRSGPLPDVPSTISISGHLLRSFFTGLT
ncbi:NAD(+) diphosphatase [Uliginosibacterium sp. H3]|uniref:NAD(+) diphosphatase n=1 Tax=Uliginosibacterium silvisoli TaxID=3114758 RepID=A0ABU6K629_9RHOO|nr:NAD(+) diphosphatase [Uliginosibacterium sp. H3]